MGLFSERDINKARSMGGGIFIDEGTHELAITNAKGFLTRKKVPAFAVDFRVLTSTNPEYEPGKILNFIALSDDDMFDMKVKDLLVAASGLTEGVDNETINKTNWNEVLDKVASTPKMIIGKPVKAVGSRVLKADGRKQAKANPALVDDENWYRANSFVRVGFYASTKSEK